MNQEAITFKGLQDIASGKLDFMDMTDYMIMDYLAKKERMVFLKIKTIENEIKIFNEAVDISTNLGVFQNINGEPLKKIELQITKEYVR
jgi:hypothetical protein